MIAGVKARRRRISTRPPAGDEPAFLARIVVTPSSLSVAVDETAQLAVAGLDQYDGDYDLTGLTVSWSSSVPGKAAVDSNGLVTGVAGGATVVTASIASAALAATCDVECVTPAAAVDHVVVSPTSLTLTEGGGTATLTADPQDASNNSLVGRTVTWASDATGVATVNSSGVVSPVAAGSANITATCETVDSDPVPVTVNAAAVGDHPNEPSGFAVILDHDFSTRTTTAHNGLQQYATGNNYTEGVTDAGDPVSPSLVHQVNIPSGYAGGGGPEHLSSTNLPADDELYIHYPFKLSSNFEGGGSGVQKLAHIWGYTNSGTASMVVPAAFGTGTSFVLHARMQSVPSQSVTATVGTVTSSQPSASPVIRAVGGNPLTRDVWHDLEIYLRYNTGSNGDGVIRFYLGGTLVLETVTFQFNTTGPKRWDKFQVNPTYMSTGFSAPAAMWIRYGHLYISNPIGVP